MKKLLVAVFWFILFAIVWTAIVKGVIGLTPPYSTLACFGGGFIFGCWYANNYIL